jgi:hypothetical protein
MTDQRGAEPEREPELPIGDVDASGVPLGHEAERRPAEDDDTAAHDDGTDVDTDDLTVQGGE